MEVRRVDDQGNPAADDVPAELQVHGPTVFREYWNKPQATREAFIDGWFRTGDITVVEGGVYRILGRSSVDIIKSGGYKVSALEVEEVLRRHEAIAECAVVGVEDEEWGQRIAACVVLRRGASLDLPSLRAWSKERLAAYKSPSLLLVVDDLPRNAMGKVQKPAVATLFASS
jgi:malonyl-CoA/methylmalonyl-CoA synthetase